MISVIMSTYKEDEKLLRESIESILNQTYRNFEYITTINNVSDKMNNSFIHFNEKIFNSKWFFSKENFKIMLYITYSVKKFKIIKISINQMLNVIWKDIKEYNDPLYLYKKINKPPA